MGKKILNEIKYWGQIFLIPIYLISFLFPRDRRIWALGSTFGKRFADNPKYFYLYLNQYQKDNVRPIWISKNREIIRFLSNNSLEGYYLYSLKGLWYSLRAKVYLYDNYSKDICFSLSGGAVKINMWHGIPLKKIQKDNIFDKVRNPKTRLEKWHWALRRMSDEKPSDYVLTTSEFLRPIFSSAFNTDNVIVCGYPRNDVLVSNNIKNICIAKEEKILYTLENYKREPNEYRKRILYMPTFRDSEGEFFKVVNLEELNNFLKKEKILFYVKLHPKSKLQSEFDRICSTNIKIIEAVSDPYIYLSKIDGLVTDYSSIYFDFLLLDKPIVFFQYDIKTYLNNSRELYFNYDDFTPGCKVNTLEELKKALLDIINEKDNYKTKRFKIKDLIFKYKESLFSERLYYEVIQILKSY